MEQGDVLLSEGLLLHDVRATDGSHCQSRQRPLHVRFFVVYIITSRMYNQFFLENFQPFLVYRSLRMRVYVLKRGRL